MEVGRWMGSLHPALIHFPIALLLLAVALEAVGFIRRDTRFVWSARICLIVGIVSALFAFVCGNFAELWAVRSGVHEDAVEYHEFLATITSWLFVGLTAWRLLMRPETRRVWLGLWIAAASFAGALLVVTGYYGGILTYQHGAAVQNIGMLQNPTDDHLLVLTQRQDEASIFYSNLMHHIFGWVVLALAVILLLDQLSPRIGAWARRVGPFLLLGAGIFLLIFSDQDAWPLYNVRPYRSIFDKEVFLHKTYAALLMAAGIGGLWQMWRRGGDAQASRSWRLHDRWMAVFALVGGALLFTHIHSAAPYANIAVGVYIHHTVMGFVALAIGAVKLLDDALPTPSRRRALAYPALMALMGVLLINYNEGLPWFMGYGRLSASAPRGGLIAPLGDYRAELVYHPEQTRLEMFVMKQDSAVPVNLPVSLSHAVVSVGNEKTEVPLTAADGQSGGAHFVGKASFLRDVPLFQVRASVPLNGKEHIADFEPWVDMRLAQPSRAPYVCPMHPYIGSATHSRCPECAMPLQPNRRPGPVRQLHAPELRMDLLPGIEPLQPGKTARLIFTPRRCSDNAIPPLESVHTQKFHLIIVSRDLSFYDHLHPQEQPDGSYALDYAFPQPGIYLLFADVTPVGLPNQVFRLPVRVEGTPPAPAPLRIPMAYAKTQGDYRIALSVSPLSPRPREETILTFSFTENGKPVTDLQPWLGAPGHCVIISEDTQDYLHSHPLLLSAPPTRAGPSVTFHTLFPRSGRYKVWGQFMHRGRLLTVDFVVRVP